jgi:hypothetical protein
MMAAYLITPEKAKCPITGLFQFNQVISALRKKDLGAKARRLICLHIVLLSTIIRRFDELIWKERG